MGLFWTDNLYIVFSIFFLIYLYYVLGVLIFLMIRETRFLQLIPSSEEYNILWLLLLVYQHKGFLLQNTSAAQNCSLGQIVNTIIENNVGSFDQKIAHHPTSSFAYQTYQITDVLSLVSLTFFILHELSVNNYK